MKKWLLIGGLTLTSTLFGFGWIATSMRVAELEVKLNRSLKSGNNSQREQIQNVNLLYQPLQIYRKEKTADVLAEHRGFLDDRKREMDYVRNQ